MLMRRVVNIGMNSKKEVKIGCSAMFFVHIRQEIQYPQDYRANLSSH